MDVLRYKNHRTYLNIVRELQFGWMQCRRAFATIVESWLENSNKAEATLDVMLSSKSELELEGRHLGQPFAIKLSPKVIGGVCLGQVLVIGSHPVSGDPVLAWTFHLNHYGDLVTEVGDAVEDGQFNQLHRNYNLLCEVCLRVAEQP